MANNLEVLTTLKESIQQQQKENENIINEMTKNYLQSLDKSLKATFTQRMDSIQSYTIDHLKETINPTALKIKTLVMSFLSGMLVMMILGMIAWYQWIRPYQVSREITQKAKNGKIYIDTSKSKIHRENDNIYLQIQ